MKMSDVTNPAMMELMFKFEDRLSEVQFGEGQLYLYSKDEDILNELIKSDEFQELQDDFNIGKSFSRSYDRIWGHYIVMA